MGLAISRVSTVSPELLVLVATLLWLILMVG